MAVINDIYEKLDDTTFASKESCDMKRSNANINCDSSMGAMLTYGSEISRMWANDKLLSEEALTEQNANMIHIHDQDFYALTTTCCQIELDKLFEGGFNTGHGTIRDPNSIATASALACIAIQSNQNDQHGGQSIPAFDYYMAPYVKLTHVKNVKLVRDISSMNGFSVSNSRVYKKAWEMTVRETEQAMEALIHNLNTMHSRAGAQVPFSSLNYGTDTSEEGRLVIRSLLKATEAGLGHGETPVFPVQVFKVKAGVNFNEGDPNYDLFKYAMYVSAKRLFPNFSFLDAEYNSKYLKKSIKGYNDPNTEVAYMGCRTRVIGNINGPEVTGGRGNLSFTTINLVKCALYAKKVVNSNKQEFRLIETFMDEVYRVFDVVVRQLLHRYEIQCARHVYNYPFLMGNGVYLDSENLDSNDTLESVLKHGTLSVGFIGLAEALTVLTGHHHGMSDNTKMLGLHIISSMREYCDTVTEVTSKNVTLLATPAEGLSGKFVKKDREEYGEIEGVTDKEYYTNSFHIPVDFDISAQRKIELEAPYHALCNAGHITYVELDGDPSVNMPAFESIIRYMHECGVGYGAINHPLDRDPVCGYVGVIGDVCPCCGRREYENIPLD